MKDPRWAIPGVQPMPSKSSSIETSTDAASLTSHRAPIYGMDRGVFAHRFQLTPAYISRDFDVIDGVGPQEARVFGVGDRELDFQDAHRVAGGPPARPGIAQQPAREDGVVQRRRRGPGKDRPPPASMSAPAHRYFTPLRA